MACADHEIHAQQGEQGEGVVLALLIGHLGLLEPLMSGKKDDDGADAEDGLDHDGHVAADIHAAKGSCVGYAAGAHQRRKAQQGMDGQENDGQRGVENALASLAVGAHKEVGHKQDEYHCKQRELLTHIEKL